MTRTKRWRSVRRTAVWAGFLLAVVSGWSGVELEGQDVPSPFSGPLRVHPSNPRYFADARGQIVYLTGSHHWENLQEVGDGDAPEAFDYTQFLDVLVAHHHNFFRLWRWEQARWGSWNGIDGLRFGPHPYPRTGSGMALDGKPKFELRRFDESYFDRLRQRVVEAGARGLYVSVMLFDGWSIEDKGLWGYNPWRAHPYHAANNSSGIDGDANGDGQGRETHALDVPEVTRLQEAYVRKVVDTVNDLDNVLYEISNESHAESAEWQYYMIRFVKEYEATKAKQHPVGMTAQWPWPDASVTLANQVLAESPADWISPAGEVFNRRVADGSKVIVADTDHLCGICGDRTFVWQSLVRGENPLFMDVWSCDVWWYPNDCDRPEWPSLRANLGYARYYAERMHLAAMTPQPQLSSNTWLLANPVESGSEYLAYLPQGGEVTLDLSATSHPFVVEWFDPELGQAVAAERVTGGGRRSFVAPFDHDAVLYLRDAEVPPAAGLAPDSSTEPLGGRVAR